MNNLIIPPKIKIGFQNRTDTYTGKLAYVIYFDNKGILRKEASWNSWRDKKIDPIEFDNIPTEGFVLNKKVGGYKSDWNYRQTYVRIYDPRNFEFEITVPNLLFILSEYDCSRGKGLEGKFVYAWDKKDLVLLPIDCETYRKSQSYTDLQSQKVKVKDLIKGASYTKKNQETVIYLGRFTKYNQNSDWNSWRRRNKDKVLNPYVFLNGKDFEFLDNVTTIAKLNSDAVVPDYAELVDKYYKSIYGSKVKKLFLKKEEKKARNEYTSSEEWYYESSPNTFIYCVSHFNRVKNELEYIDYVIKLFVENGIIKTENYKKYWAVPSYKPTYYGSHYSYYADPYIRINEFVEPTNQSLWAELESGSKYKVSSSSTLY